MGRPKKQEHSPEPEDISQEEPEATNFHSDGALPSQAEMIRQAMAAGMETPGDGTDWIKKKYGFEMKRSSWSASRAQIRNRESGEPREPRVSRQHSPVPPQPTGIPQGFSSDVKTLKGLIDKFGGNDELSELIGDLSHLISKYGESGLQELLAAFA